ncbi:MAG: hypothetical protein ACKOW4_00650 [Aquirufa sp.]|jgi:hypothetical protein
MEVHHHSHQPKSWKEYVQEFLMLFAAVTLGFFAENLRERISENANKKEIMESVAYDFQKDISHMNFHKNFNLRRIKVCDSLNNLVKLPASQIEQQLYYRLMVEMPHTYLFTSSNKSRIEAEAKGYFSRRENKELADAIAKYDFYLSELVELFKTDVNTLSSFIDYKVVHYVNPDLFEKAARIPTKNLPYKMGIDEIKKEDVKELRVLLANKTTLLDHANIVLDSMHFYANKSIQLIEKQVKE